MTNIQDELRRKIGESNAYKQSLLNGFESSSIPSFVQQLEIESVEQRIKDLERQLDETEDVETRDELVITLHPPGMDPGEIPVRVLSSLLGGLQNLSDSVANTLYNQPSERGSIPSDIVKRNTLIWKKYKASSFQVTLDVEHQGQASLYIDEPVQTQTLGELFTLFDVADSPELLVESVSNLGPRTLKQYRDWTRLIKEFETPLEIEWRSIKGKTKVDFDSSKAERILKVLEDITDTNEEEIVLEGRLTGANVRTMTFELCQEDGEKITGRVAKEARPILTTVLDKRCKAKLTKAITTYGSNNRQKIVWSLLYLESIEK